MTDQQFETIMIAILDVMRRPAGPGMGVLGVNASR
jgi:hypothetical protein